MLHKAFYLSFLLCCGLTRSYASINFPKQVFMASHNPVDAQKVTWGLQFGTGVWAGSVRVGTIGEYRMRDWLGLQVGVLYFRHQYFLEGTFSNTQDNLALVQLSQITVPLILRSYITKTKQKCIFGGLHISYLLDGTLGWYETKSKQKYIAPEDLQQLNPSKFGCALLLGGDVVLGYGLTFGMTFIYELTDVLNAGGSSLNWTLAPTLSCNLLYFFKHKPAHLR